MSVDDEVLPAHDEIGPTWWLVGVLAAVAFMAVLVSTASGPGLSPDSTGYISVGLNLAKGEGFINWAGETLTIWPPGLPVVIALGELVGVGPYWTLRLVNAATIAAIVALSATLLYRNVRNRQLAVGATVFVAVSVALLGVAKWAWTEPLFILVTLLFIMSLEQALRAPQKLRWLVAAAALAWAAFLLRYAGISLIAAGTLTVLVGQWPARPSLAIRNTLVFGAIASLVPVAWMLRNRSIDGTLMGPRVPSIDTPVQIAFRIGRTVGEWLLPFAGLGRLHDVIGLVALGAVAVAVVWALRRTGTANNPSLEWLALLPVAVFGLVYVAYMTVAQLTAAFDRIGSRLLSPVFVPLVVLVAVVLDHASRQASARARRWAGAALVGVIVVQGAAFARDAVLAGRDGLGYASSTWRDNELVAATTELPDDAVLYSSTPDGIWAVTRRAPVLLSPTAESSSHGSDVPPSFLADVACGQAWLAWFDTYRDYLFTPEELAAFVTLEPVEVLADGTLYRVESLGPGGCDDRPG